MGKNKLRKFAEMESFGCVFQYPYAVISQQPFPLKGRWHEYFGNTNPIVLELGCGKGEYAVGLAELCPDKNFIGIDIKGARMYTGAKQAEQRGLRNVAFLRTNIEMLASFFAPSEVSEIWITFPDPQMKKVRKRLTATNFLALYRRVLADGGRIHLKTDSPFLYTYTREMLRASDIAPIIDTADLYGGGVAPQLPPIRTHYEQQWLQRGMSIKFLSFALPHSAALSEPDVEIEPDSYRSYSHRSNKMQPSSEN